MSVVETLNCPECDGAFDYPPAPPVDRRDFLRLAGAGVAAVAAGSQLQAAATPTPKKVRPAEELVRELASTLNDAQKKRVLLPYDHGTGKGGTGGKLSRLGMYNAAFGGTKLEDVYTKPQIELVERIVRAMANGDEGWRLVSRGGTWDASKSFERTGAHLFGNPNGKEPWAFMFSGHHLTIRCDGNFSDGIAFGGPIYYGHTPYGYSDANLFYYQTKSVLSAYEALDGKQREKAVVKGSPGEGEGSIKFKKKDEERPGILYKDLSRDQQTLVAKVMRDVLLPFRPEDADEVMEAIKRTGGMEKIHLAFYSDTGKAGKKEKDAWSFWRLEGPGFVWNYRVLDHVHTYVNISSKLA